MVPDAAPSPPPWLATAGDDHTYAIFNELKDEISESVRAIIQEGMASIRLDVCTILHDEFAHAQNSSSPRSSGNHHEGASSYTSHESCAEGPLCPPRAMPHAAPDWCSPPACGEPVSSSLNPRGVEANCSPGSRALIADGARSPLPPPQEKPEPPTNSPNAMTVDTWQWNLPAIPAAPRPNRFLSSADTRKVAPLFDDVESAPAPRLENTHVTSLVSQWSTNSPLGAGGSQASTAASLKSPGAARGGSSLSYTATLEELKEARRKRMLEIEERRQQALEERNSLGLYAHMKEFVSSVYFDSFFGVLVVINTCILGVQVDWQARSASSNPPHAFRIIDLVFCVVFTLEWALRLLAHGHRFFSRRVWFWHLFDTIVVGTQLFEEVAQVSAKGAASFEDRHGSLNNDGGVGHSSALRLLRFLRLLRIMRTVRILRLVGELRTLVLSIAGSLRALLWAVVLLVLLMFVIGIFVTQIVSDHLHDLKGHIDPVTRHSLEYFFGSLGDTVVSVYKGISGGVDWGDLVEPLKAISPCFVPFFMMYIAFATLCMLNVITGVFVESALVATKRDNNAYLIQRLKDLLHLMDLNGDAQINSVELFLASDTPEIQAVFTDLDLPLQQQDKIFEALGTCSEHDSISIEEFVCGCQAMSSPAKTYDVKLIQIEHGKTAKKMQEWQENVELTLSRLIAKLDEAVGSSRTPRASTPPESTVSVPQATHQHQPSLARAWSAASYRSRDPLFFASGYEDQEV